MVEIQQSFEKRCEYEIRLYHTEVGSTDSFQFSIEGVNKPGKLRYYELLKLSGVHSLIWAKLVCAAKKCTIKLFEQDIIFNWKPLKKSVEIYMCGVDNFPWVPPPLYPSMLLTNFECHSGCNGPDRITRRTGIQPIITWRGLTKFQCFSCT